MAMRSRLLAMQKQPSAVQRRARQCTATASNSSARSLPPLRSMWRSRVKSCWMSSTSTMRARSMIQVDEPSVGFRPSGSKSTAFFDMLNNAFSPTFICETAAVQTGEVCGSPRARTSSSPCSGYDFLSSTARIFMKAMWRFRWRPSKNRGSQAALPSTMTFFFTTSPSPTVGRTTSRFSFLGFGGSSFLIIVGWAMALFSAACVGDGSSGTPSRASARTTEPSLRLFGSPARGLISSSSRPSQVSLISFGGTRMLYFKFSFRWPGVEFGSTGTLTSPDGKITFNCIAGPCGTSMRRAGSGSAPTTTTDGLI
mmetsp:Transcript_48092/g.140152  ORF Transcript_48092/g.140152 Transcript_48092/m.140152 type:complete len:311 (-) Transcript_48092:11-943(-)